MPANIQFKRATRNLVKLKALIMGPSNGGKTLGALRLAEGIAPGKIALIDSENDRSSYYADRVAFDVLSLPDSNPKTYIAAIDAAVAAGYEVLIIDSLTHAWQNILDRKDAYDKVNPKEKFSSWATFGAEWMKLVRHILEAPINVIGTARSKQAYEKVDGSNKIEKLGMHPILREGAEYEFALVFDVNHLTHLAKATKDNTGVFDTGPTALWDLCDPKTARELKNWLAVGEELPQPSAAMMSDIDLVLNELDLAGHPKAAAVRTRYQTRLRKGLDDAAASEVLAGLRGMAAPTEEETDEPASASAEPPRLAIA